MGQQAGQVRGSLNAIISLGFCSGIDRIRWLQFVVQNQALPLRINLASSRNRNTPNDSEPMPLLPTARPLAALALTPLACQRSSQP